MDKPLLRRPTYGFSIRAAETCHSARPTYARHLENSNRVLFEIETSLSVKDGYLYTGPALIDTGSQVNLLPLKHIPYGLRKYIRPAKMEINGVSDSTVAAKGCIKVKFSFESGALTTNFYVIDLDVPILIGNETLLHRSIIDFNIGKESIKLYRTSITGKSTFTNTIPYRKQNVKVFLSRPEEKSPPSQGTPEAKCTWLKEHLDLTLPTDDVDKDELNQIIDLLIEYEDVFASSHLSHGTFPSEVPILTETGKVKNVRSQRIPKAKEAQADQAIQDMLEKNVIELCPNPKGWNSPLVAVNKKNGETRICANFKKTINLVLDPESDKFQMPDTETTFHDIGRGNRYFSTLDLKSGYWHFRIRQEDRHKTAFQHKGKTYQFIRLPFGLKNSGDLFSRAVTKACAEVAKQDNFKTYVDDICCYGKTFADYKETLIQLLKTCRKYNMRLSGPKCTFLQKQAKFLGRIVTSEGYSCDPDYADGFQSIDAPTTKRQLLSLQGRLNWLRDQIRASVGEKVAEHCFSHVVSEITKLNRKDTKFKWTDKADKALNHCKTVLSSPDVMAFADFTQPFVLVTDASDVAMGAVLMQNHGGIQRIVATGSKTFSETEQRWSATEREGFAIVYFVEKFEYFLRGKPFVLLTDHKALTAMDRTFLANKKLQRWQDRLSEYDFVVQYIPGQDNVIADMLSRPFSTTSKHPTVNGAVSGKFYQIDAADSGGVKIHVYVPGWINPQLPDELVISRAEEVKSGQSYLTSIASFENKTLAPALFDLVEGQDRDPKLAKIIGYLRGKVPIENWKLDLKCELERSYHQKKSRLQLHKTSGALILKTNGISQFVLTQKMARKYLQMAHDEKGHAGADRVIHSMSNLWWPGKTDDIKLYCSSCNICLRRKGNYIQRSRLPCGHIKTGDRPFQNLTVDFVHMPQSARGKRYMLTIMCNFSRYIHAIPTTHNRAKDAVEGLISFMLDKGIPESIGSDRGVHFDNELFAELCAKLRIQHNLHLAYRPQSSGNLERAHRSLKNSLWILAEAQDLDWEEALPYTLHALNRSWNAATKRSPHFIIYGREPDLTGIELDGPKGATPIAYGLRIRKILEIAHSAVQKAQSRANVKLDKRLEPAFSVLDLKPGDFVHLKRDQSVKSSGGKFPWIGPYEVLKVNDHFVKIDKNGDIDFVHREHVVKVFERDPRIDPETNLDHIWSGPNPETPDEPISNDFNPSDSTSSSDDLIGAESTPATVRKSSRKRFRPKKLDL